MKNLQIPAGRRGFANLTNDVTFKRVFGQEESKDVLISFLNRFIGRGEIMDVDFLPTEQLPPAAEDRRVVFDINVRARDGSQYIIEMQLLKQEHFHERALLYSTYPILSQGAREKEEFRKSHPGEGFKWDFDLKPVRFIAVLNFRMEHGADWEEEDYLSSYRLYEDTAHELLHDKLQFMFLELARFNKTEEELTSIYDKWMYLFKNMKFLTERPDVFNEKEFDHLFELAKLCNFTQNEYMEYQRFEFGNSDYYNALEYAKKQAGKEGREEGRAEGRAEGRKERDLEIARNMLADGVSLEIVKKYIGLEDKDLESLKAGLQ